MKKTKVEQVLDSLDKRDIKRFKKFVASPYFNVNPQLDDLLNYYVNWENELEPEEIWKYIKAKGSFSNVRFRKYQSDLTKLILNYLAIENFSSNNLEVNLNAIQAIRKNNIQPLFKTVLRKAEELTSGEQKLSPDFLLFKVKLEKERYQIEHKNNRISASNLIELLETLDEYYITEKLKFATDLKSRAKYVSREHEVSFIDQILSYIKNNKESSPIAQIYRLVYLTQISEVDDNQFFLELEKLLSELNDQLDKEEANSIYTSLINYCIRKINTGQRQFLQKLLNIYKSLIGLDLIVENGSINSIKYRNIIVTALRCQESNWAENFAIEYAEFLPANIKENQLRFQLSAVYFYKREFDKVIEVLRDFEFTDLIENLGTKATLIQTYYELNEFDVLDSLLKSLRTYITRHKELDSGRRLNFKNLIKIMSQLISVIPGDQKKIDKIKKTLNEMKGIAVNRTWIDEKIAALEK